MSGDNNGWEKDISQFDLSAAIALKHKTFRETSDQVSIDTDALVKECLNRIKEHIKDQKNGSLDIKVEYPCERFKSPQMVGDRAVQILQEKGFTCAYKKGHWNCDCGWGEACMYMITITPNW